MCSSRDLFPIRGIGRGYHSASICQELVDKVIQFRYAVGIFVCQIICLANVFRKVVEFYAIGLVVVVAIESDEFPIAFANISRWQAICCWRIVRKVAEDGVPCEGFAAKCGGKTDAVNRFGGVEAAEFGQCGKEIDALYDCLIVAATRFNMIGPRDNQWFAGAAFVGICLSASSGARCS